jgi:transposase
MLTWETNVEAQALYARGWTKSAIARHLGINRRTVREYLKSDRVPGQRVAAAPDGLAPFAEYTRLRLTDDPHLWASTLFDELTALGYAGSYPSFTRALRTRTLRPHCEPCAASRGREHAVISHPPGAETQWDWLELPDPPGAWGWGRTAHLLVGALAHSSRWRAVLAEAEDQAQLIEALDGVVRRLGGVSQRWRFDRMATVCHPGSGRLTASFAPVAIHYGAGVDICPSRHGNRKGVVEKGNHSLAQRWWRTLPDHLSPTQAQAHLDAFCVRVGDARPRRRDGEATTVGALADAEPLRPPPALPYPATVVVPRTVSAQALVSYRGNSYSVPPGLAGTTVQVSHRLGAATVDIATGATVLARHRREPDGAGVVVRDAEHVAALERAVLAAFTDRAPCRAKVRRPPSVAALAEADRLRGAQPAPGAHVVVDLAQYVAATSTDRDAVGEQS